MGYSVDKYDIDDLYDHEYTDTDEERLRALYAKGITHYRTKTIKSGNMLECEIYPVWNNQASLSRARKLKESRKEQKNLNHKNAVKNIIRLINANFTDNDIWGTFTYGDDKLPKTEDEANANMQKYIRKLRIDAAKRGYAPLKYVYVTEFGEQRVNHHFVTNYPDRDRAEQLWKGGARKQTRRLQADEYGYEGMARYILKDPKGKKRYVTSRNLTKPTIIVADYKFTRRKANKVATGDIDAQRLFEKMYKKYRFTDLKVKTSDYVDGVYLYVRMRRQN